MSLRSVGYEGEADEERTSRRLQLLAQSLRGVPVDPSVRSCLLSGKLVPLSSRSLTLAAPVPLGVASGGVPKVEGRDEFEGKVPHAAAIPSRVCQSPVATSVPRRLAAKRGAGRWDVLHPTQSSTMSETCLRHRRGVTSPCYKLRKTEVFPRPAPLLVKSRAARREQETLAASVDPTFEAAVASFIDGVAARSGG